MYRVISALLLLLLCCGCAGEQDLPDLGPYLFEVEKGFALETAASGRSTYEITEMECSEPVYGLLAARETYRDIAANCDLYFVSRAPFTVKMQKERRNFTTVLSGGMYHQGRVYEYAYVLEGSQARDIGGETWYTVPLDDDEAEGPFVFYWTCQTTKGDCVAPRMPAGTNLSEKVSLSEVLLGE